MTSEEQKEFDRELESLHPADWNTMTPKDKLEWTKTHTKELEEKKQEEKKKAEENKPKEGKPEEERKPEGGNNKNADELKELKECACVKRYIELSKESE
ncbi:hypothetical protein FACS189449_09600 [Alphaproteobacteria bacterium]|nr:hypothetical protein FACS189449_09600 [Alphaproteobacteria bacterium]